MAGVTAYVWSVQQIRLGKSVPQALIARKYSIRQASPPARAAWAQSRSVARCSTSLPVETCRDAELDRQQSGSSGSLTPTFDDQLPTEDDLKCIEERQLRHPVTAFCVSKAPCRHGFPQAFGYTPCGHKINSGLFRLTCPLLVQAIDKFEAEGAIPRFNQRLQADESLQRELREINRVWGSVRKARVTPSQRERTIAALGESAAEHLLNSGVAGLSPDKVDDVKCLHAHVADYLIRGEGSNWIGRDTLAELEERGYQVEGNSVCWQQCDASHPVTESSWNYIPQKNRQRLRQRKPRHQAKRVLEKAAAERRRAQAAAEAGDGGGAAVNGVGPTV